MATEWVLEFDAINQENISHVGTKCANLRELSRIGMPVPPGFAVTTEAYDYFLTETGASQEVNERLTKFTQRARKIAEYEELSRTLYQVITTKEMPEQLRKHILRAYKTLCEEWGATDVSVAVRSSGVAEDLPTAAFAGQYDSHLNVRGEKELLRRVKECWASLFTARVISYQIRNNLPITGRAMGVIVQKLVNARSAGVVFTVLPSTGDTSWIMIEGNWGTGESVVQGVAIPDKWFVNKETLKLEEKSGAQKLKQISLGETGTKEEEIPPDKQSIPCLSDEEAVKIAELAKRIESHYGSPQDIEWVVDQDLPFPKNIFLVQTRPVTTLQKKSPTDQIVDLMLKRPSSGTGFEREKT